MVSPERRPNNILLEHLTDLTKVKFSQSLKTSLDNLPNEATESPFQTIIERHIFEENNVDNRICDALFEKEASKNFKIFVTSSGLTIETYRAEESRDKRASMRLCLSEGCFRSYLFVTNGNRYESVPKGVNIKPADYLKIARIFEKIATKQRSIK